MRKTICTSFVTLGHVRPAMLVPIFKNIVNFVLAATVDPDPDLALEACEFWAIASEKSIMKNELSTILSSLDFIFYFIFPIFSFIPMHFLFSFICELNQVLPPKNEKTKNHVFYRTIRFKKYTNVSSFLFEV